MIVIRSKPLLLMKITTVLFISAILGCGTPPSKKPKTIIGKPKPAVNIPKEEIPVIKEPKIPEGAVSANFLSDNTPFYAFVHKVDKKKGITTIRFEKPNIPHIVLPETYGASLSMLRFDEFDRDLLLVTAKLKDPVFNKYYLYVHRNNTWKLVVNGFAIHQDNNPHTLEPIVVDPDDPTKMLRYYSVFDLDKTSNLGYTWRLLTESIPIKNK